MANHYTANKDEWKALADIDYFGMFVKAYIPFNAWLNVTHSQYSKDREKINAIKRENNPFRNRIYVLLETETQEGSNFRNSIGELHSLLENHYIYNQDKRITFSDIILGKNPDNVKEDSFRGIGFRVQYGNGGTDKHTHSLIKSRKGNAIFTKTQEDYNLSELKACPDFEELKEEYKSHLLYCYEMVVPDLKRNLLSGFNATDPNQYYMMGQFKFVKDKEYIAQGLIEILYNLRNSLFHGELTPNKEANKIYGAAYKILRELIEAL